MALLEKPESQGLYGVDLKKIIQQQRVGGVMGLRLLRVFLNYTLENTSFCNSNTEYRKKLKSAFMSESSQLS